MINSLICKESVDNTYFTKGEIYEVIDIDSSKNNKIYYIIRNNKGKLTTVPLVGRCFTFDFYDGGEIKKYLLTQKNIELISKALLKSLQDKESDLQISKADVLEVLRLFKEEEEK